MHASMRTRRQLALLAAAALTATALAGCITASDNDGDGVLDVDDPDDDNDRVPDAFEDQFGFDRLNATDAAQDADGDGLSLLEEYEAGLDPRDGDTDGDTMADGWEVSHGFDPLDAGDAGLDGDGDGLTNAAEFANGTSPSAADTDGDGMPDGWEVGHGLNPLSPSDAVGDDDGDGLSNRFEHASGTDPNEQDSDGDLMGDNWEVTHGLDPTDGEDAAFDPDLDSFDLDNSGAIDGSERFTNLREYEAGTDPQDADSDFDGMTDGYEWGFGLDPTNDADAGQDLDGDGALNLQEALAGSSPTRTDTDNDTLPDGWEIAHGLDPADAADAGQDADGDGLANLDEYLRGADPTDPDTDNDGAADGLDADPARDLQVTLRVTGVWLALASTSGEGAFDPPFELMVRVTIGGTARPDLSFNMTGSSNTTGGRDDLDLVFRVDVDDRVWNVTLTVELWELDLVETVGVSDDDLIDIDPTGANYTLAFSLDLVTGALSGEVSEPSADGAADGLLGEPDGRIDFQVST